MRLAGGTNTLEKFFGLVRDPFGKWWIEHCLKFFPSLLALKKKLNLREKTRHLVYFGFLRGCCSVHAHT